MTKSTQKLANSIRNDDLVHGLFGLSVIAAISPKQSTN
jgi:hypothetical protein